MTPSERVVERRVLGVLNNSSMTPDLKVGVSHELGLCGWRIVAERIEPAETEAERLAKELDAMYCIETHESDFTCPRKKAAAWIRAHDPERRKP